MQIGYTAAEVCGLGLLVARLRNGYGCRIFRCCPPERSCLKESWQVGPKISMSRKRLLHILSLYL